MTTKADKHHDTNLKVFEVSPVMVGAGQSTRVLEMKSGAEEYQDRKLLRSLQRRYLTRQIECRL